MTDADTIADLMQDLAMMTEQERALRMLHQPEMFGDCTEDGDTYPCKTIRILNWKPGSSGLCEKKNPRTGWICDLPAEHVRSHRQLTGGESYDWTDDE